MMVTSRLARSLTGGRPSPIHRIGSHRPQRHLLRADRNFAAISNSACALLGPAPRSDAAPIHRFDHRWRRRQQRQSAAFSSDASESKDDDDASNSAEEADDEPKPEEHTEVVNKETLQFQAETKQLLDIVTHSLYTDKEVFLRELISNASDALEKLRHVQVANEGKTINPDVPFEIRVETDELNGTLTITDTGIGLTREEMISNLGTIARSGSKAFVNEMAKGATADGGSLDASRGIIGKFGVGFYSAFMVGDKIEVRSKSAYKTEEGSSPLVWSSTGVGGYDISDLPSSIRQDRGSSVLIHLKESHAEFSDEKRVEGVLKKYSNFVNFPIFLNGNRVNTMEAIWAHEPSSVSDEKYTDFYKFIAHAYDDPLDRLHYRADAPVEIKALFYVPSFHSEKYGAGRMEPGVSLYSRKVLIESKSPDILPEWMRFVRGVVDSEDLPLSISREKPQDTALISKLRKALTRKFISHLTTMAKKNPSKYKDEFYKEYAFFLKEGICQDYEFQEPLSKLLFFETSKTMAGELSSLDEYVSRCTPEQKEIYYLCAPTRDLAMESPYLEAFEKAGREVIFVYKALDEFVMSNLEKFQGRSLTTVEKRDIDLGAADKSDDKKDEGDEDDAAASRLSDKDAPVFCAWVKQTLGEKVSTVKTTNRLGSSPAIVTDNESGAMRRMMCLVDTQDGGSTEAMPLKAQQLELNPKHPIIVGIDNMRGREPNLAKACLEQIFDNALVAAGLLDDGRSMLPRLNDLLLCVVKGAEENYDENKVEGQPSAEGKKDELNLEEKEKLEGQPSAEGEKDELDLEKEGEKDELDLEEKEKLEGQPSAEGENDELDLEKKQKTEDA